MEGGETSGNHQAYRRGHLDITILNETKAAKEFCSKFEELNLLVPRFTSITELVNEGDVLVSYDVTALFTNIPVDEASQILANKAFKNNWFNNTYKLQLRKADLIELLSVSVKNQLFQFDGKLLESIDGVAMGSPLGPLLANVFMCSLEEQLQEDGTIPTFYKRYVR